MGPDSCHDPAVKDAIVKGVGLRLRINSTKDEYFEDSVEDAAKAFKISGYNYTKTKQELLKFKSMDPVELIKKPKKNRTRPEKGVQAFYIDSYDPRMPHPRRLISNKLSLSMLIIFSLFVIVFTLSLLSCAFTAKKVGVCLSLQGGKKHFLAAKTQLNKS